MSQPVTEIDSLEPLRVTQSQQIYDEEKPLKEILLPEFIAENLVGAKYKQRSFKQINDFGIDENQNIYAIYQEHVLKVDRAGTISAKKRLNSEFNAGFTVDSRGKSYFFLNSKKILVLSDLFENERLIDLEDSLAKEEICVRMQLDPKEDFLFFQTYNNQNFAQKLYKTNLKSGQIELLYEIKKSPCTIPQLRTRNFFMDN